MDKNKIEELFRLVQEMEEEGECPVSYGNGASEKLIKRAENAIGHKFPPSYLSFVKKYGTLSAAGQEFYGLINDNFTKSTIPNAVWVTLKERNDFDLPFNYFIVYQDGEGRYYVLDLNEVDNDNECAIMTWAPGKASEFEKSNFGEFIYEIINDAYEYW